jgi:CRISPR-associated protein Csm2
MSPVPVSDIHTIITDPKGAETLVKWADQTGKNLKEMRLTTSQIRALFGEVRQIQAQWNMPGEQQQTLAARRLVLLKPKMAYRARRESGRAVEELRSVLDPALDEVIKEKDPVRQHENFNHFVDFFEAILAYHKSYGGN